MSRIGKLPIPINNQIEFTISADNMVTVKGQKGLVHCNYIQILN